MDRSVKRNMLEGLKAKHKEAKRKVEKRHEHIRGTLLDAKKKVDDRHMRLSNAFGRNKKKVL